MFPPDQPPPPDTVALYTWWDPARRDNFTTSDPAWAGRSGDHRFSYVFVRKEGYVYANPVAGTWRLTGSWNGTSAVVDNRLSSDPRRQPAGYSINRTEGFALPAGGPQVHPVFYGWRQARLQGSRPVLTVLVQNVITPPGTSAFPSTRSPAHFRSLFWGPATPNLATFFHDNSQGVFTVSNAGVIGPFTVTGFSTFQAAMPSVIRQAATVFDFSRYDTNGDGSVTPNELAIIYINESNGWWGQTSQDSARMRTCVTDPRRVCVVPFVSGMWMHADLMHAAHELFHQLSPRDLDLYGDICHSKDQTLMSCTPGPDNSTTANTEQLRDAFHLDPWHKMTLGWLTPRMLVAGNGGGCTTLDPPNAGVGWGRPPLLITSAVNPDRYYFAEFRDPTRGTATDRSHPGTGVVLWYVGLDGALNPRVVPGGTMRPGQNNVIDSARAGDDINWSGTGAPPWTNIFGGNRVPESAPVGDDFLGKDAAVWTVGSPANGVPGARGGISTWGPADGQAGLTFSQNRPVSTRALIFFRVGNLGLRAVEWWDRSSGGFRPRVDNALPAELPPGAILTLNGMFGVDQAGRRIMLEGPAGRFRLTVHTWTCDRVSARVPTSLPPGTYRLVVYGDTGSTLRSNGMAVRISAG